MRTLRTLHLYLGSLFAPALLALAVSGSWQVYRWNDAKKDGSYTPPPVVRLFSDIHKDQVLPGGRHGQNPSMQLFLGLASIGLTLTTLLGIVMAYKVSRRPVIVTALLLAGVLLPTFLLTTCAKPASAKPGEEKKEVKKAAPLPWRCGFQDERVQRAATVHLPGEGGIVRRYWLYSSRRE